MKPENNKSSAFILGLFVFLGLAVLGYLLADAAIRYKEYERTVTVKGLAEQEHPADIVIWPVQFTIANNDLPELYDAIEKSTDKIRKYLETNGIAPSEITLTSPAITDKSAQSYGNAQQAEFRYSAVQVVTVYSQNIDQVQRVMKGLPQLGKQGIAFTGGNYETRPEYIFASLNDIKPDMIEQATTKAREVATKFANDSGSKLGKIKRASQGQFSITGRDKNNPHIKRIRVVSTVEYYLSD
ncbi:MAG: SIMPL domain-containing protein [Arenicellales bacterium]